ncbi:MAG: type II toxin-antitoxin system RelE/ParE family toxin [Candidatus Omnitrophica bacterium]|nr:type II toxin-antitoxin system RelE/ParE family toxin [Candidatus Omnitrophota bacterium]
MTWQIRIHKLVLTDDFCAIPLKEKETILKTIKKKLSFDPEAYGKPLTGEFKGLWRLRVGDYRVVYRMVKTEILVLVIKVGIRRDDRVYKELFQRLNKI